MCLLIATIKTCIIKTISRIPSKQCCAHELNRYKTNENITSTTSHRIPLNAKANDYGLFFAQF